MTVPTPLAYYKFESGALTTDSVAGTYNLTNDNTVTSVAGGIIGNAADFVTASSQSLHNNSILGATSYPRSFVIWAKPDIVTVADRAFLSLSDGSVHYYSLKIRASDSHIVFRSNNNTQAGDVDTGIVAVVGTQYQLVVVQNSATSVDLYVNAVKTNSAAATFVATVSEFYLGYLGRSAAWYYDGKLDEGIVFNAGLVQADVDFLYASGAPGTNQQYPFVQTSRKVLNGLAMATVKTRNGLAIASVKAVNGLA